MGWTRELEEFLSMLVVTSFHTLTPPVSVLSALAFHSCQRIYKEHRNYKIFTYKNPTIYINYLETGFLRVPGHWRYPNRFFVSPNLFKPSDSLISTPLILHTIFYLKPKQHPLWHILQASCLAMASAFLALYYVGPIVCPMSWQQQRDIWAVQTHLGTITLVVSSHLSCISQLHQALESLERFVRDFYLIPLCLILTNSSVLLHKGYFNCNIDSSIIN